MGRFCSPLEIRVQSLPSTKCSLWSDLLSQGTEHPLTGRDNLSPVVVSLRRMCVSHTCNELPFKINLMFLFAKRAKLHLHLIPSSDTVSPGSRSPLRSSTFRNCHNFSGIRVWPFTANKDNVELACRHMV